MHEKSNDLAVAILAGGMSSRMGTDKALLPWGSGTLLDHVIDIARCIGASKEALVVGDRPAYRGRGVRVVPDSYPGAGPLGGIATALRWWQGGRILVLAVDMPLLCPSLLNAMAGLDLAADALVPRTMQVARNGATNLAPESLHAIYRATCIDAFERRLEEGQFKVADAFDGLDVKFLDPDWLCQFDPRLRSFENVNTEGAFRDLWKECGAADWLA